MLTSFHIDALEYIHTYEPYVWEIAQDMQDPEVIQDIQEMELAYVTSDETLELTLEGRLTLMSEVPNAKKHAA